MELRHLRYFVALAEQQSFTKAARLVHISQPTLSHQINQLEKILGKQLVIRGCRRVELTPEGEAFLPHATAILSAVDRSIVDLANPHRRTAGHVRVGAPATLAASVVSKAVSMLLKTEHGIRVRVDEIRSMNEIRRRLMAETLDLAVVYPPIEGPGLDVEPLYEEQAVLFVRKDHPLAGRRSVRLVDLHGHGLVLPHGTAYRRQLDGLLHSVGAVPEVVVEVAGFGMLHSMVENTGLAAIVAENAVAAGGDFATIPIERPLPVRIAALCVKRQRTQTPAAQALIGAIRKLAAERRRLRPRKRN